VVRVTPGLRHAATTVVQEKKTARTITSVPSGPYNAAGEAAGVALFFIKIGHSIQEFNDLHHIGT
jgi:hypothetical protein